MPSRLRETKGPISSPVGLVQIVMLGIPGKEVCGNTVLLGAYQSCMVPEPLFPDVISSRSLKMSLKKPEDHNNTETKSGHSYFPYLIG